MITFYIIQHRKGNLDKRIEISTSNLEEMRPTIICETFIELLNTFRNWHGLNKVKNSKFRRLAPKSVIVSMNTKNKYRYPICTAEISYNVNDEILTESFIVEKYKIQ